MDQFASMFGKADHVIKLDCADLSYTYFPFKLEGICIVLFDTFVKHSLNSKSAQYSQINNATKLKILENDSNEGKRVVVNDKRDHE